MTTEDEINQHKLNRDELNKQVKRAKTNRDNWNKKVVKYAEELAKKKMENAPKQGPTVSSLKKSLKALEYDQMTKVLTVPQERTLVHEMSGIQAQINKLESVVDDNDDIKIIREQVRHARTKAEYYHKLVDDLAKQSQQEHDAITAIINRGK